MRFAVADTLPHISPPPRQLTRLSIGASNLRLLPLLNVILPKTLTVLGPPLKWLNVKLPSSLTLFPTHPSPVLFTSPYLQVHGTHFFPPNPPLFPLAIFLFTRASTYICRTRYYWIWVLDVHDYNPPPHVRLGSPYLHRFCLDRSAGRWRRVGKYAVLV